MIGTGARGSQIRDTTTRVDAFTKLDQSRLGFHELASWNANREILAEVHSIGFLLAHLNARTSATLISRRANSET